MLVYKYADVMPYCEKAGDEKYMQELSTIWAHVVVIANAQDVLGRNPQKYKGADGVNQQNGVKPM